MPKHPLPRTAWKPGVSANPGGKPKLDSVKKKTLHDIKEAARELSLEAIATLKRAMTAKRAPWACRIAAANAILDRGWGKPKEHIDLEMKGPTLEELVIASFRQPQTIEGELAETKETPPSQAPGPAQEPQTKH